MNSQCRAKVLVRLIEEEQLELDYLYERVKLLFTKDDIKRPETVRGIKAMKALVKAQAGIEEARNQINAIAQREWKKYEEDPLP